MTEPKEPKANEERAEIAKAENLAQKRQMITELRLLRTEFSSLLDCLKRVKAGQIDIKEKHDYIRTTVGDIETLLGNIEQKDVTKNDSIRTIFNLWERMQHSPVLRKAKDDLPSQKLLHEISSIEESIDEIIEIIGIRTIPARVEDWMKKTTPGSYLPFHMIFEDELPAYESRLKVLNLLACFSKGRTGLVDTTNGLIYNCGVEEDEKKKSLYLFLIILVFFSAVAFFTPRLNLGFDPLAKDKLLIFHWFIFLGGIATHIGIANVKKFKNSGLPPIITGEYVRNITHARKGEFLLKSFMAFFVFWAFVFSTDGDSLKTYNAFLVGYGMDSFMEIFGATIEQKTSQKLSSLKSQLGLKNQ